MTSLFLVIAVGGLFAAGVMLLLERSLTRVLLGFVFIGNGANVLILTTGGRAGAAPILGEGGGRLSDPLPQAMVLTAIVITLGVVAFLLALAHRSWELDGDDDVQDDVEDARVAGRLAGDEAEVETGADADAQAAAEAAADATGARP